MEITSDAVIEIDLAGVQFLNSKELSRLLIIKKKYEKTINFQNVNDHIIETLSLMAFDSLFNVTSRRKGKSGD